MKKVMTQDTLGELANEILKKAHELNSDTATLITLCGDLGTGKTTLTQRIASELGIKENIISPTFVIMKKYNIRDSKFKFLIHIDAYRLEKSAELIKLGWQELIKEKENLIILEWPEQVPDCTTKDAIKIKLSHVDSTNRSIEFLA